MDISHSRYWFALFCAALLPITLSAASGARQVADLNPGSVGSFPTNLAVVGDRLYFSAYTLRTGREPWKYDGTSITLVADINNTADDIGGGIFEGNDSAPSGFTGFNGSVYFSAFDPRRGGELWRYDGAAAVRVADINPDQNDAIKNNPNSSWPSGLTVFNNVLYFSASSGTTLENYEPWRYDGASARQVYNIHPDLGSNYSSFPSGLTLFNGLFFMANDGSHGYELWRHNGTDTTLIDINPGGSDSSSYPKFFTLFNNNLYFQAFHSTSGFELWKTDGSTATLALDLNSGSGSSYPEFMTLFNGALHFRASDPTYGSELWKYNGSQAQLAADINPSGDAFPKNLTPFRNLLLFAADDGVHGWELWKYDGSTASLVFDLNPAGDSFPEFFTILNDALYFVATTPDTGYEVWKYDGVSVSLAADVNSGPGSSFPRSLTPFAGQLYFSAAEDGASNWELWALSNAPLNQPPTVALTSPASGSTFLTTETITITANASDDGSIAKVEFLANGTLLASDSAAPYSFSGQLAAGTYTVTAKATDNAGASSTSTGITITIQPPANQPPAVTLTSPANGSAFLTTETITITANASDDGSIAKVEFLANGTLLGSDSTAPYGIEITLSPGSYTIIAKATDNAGSGTDSTAVAITVQSGAGNQPPTITLNVEQTGNTLIAPASVTLRVTASDSDGTVAQVEIFNGTSSLGSKSSAPYDWILNSLAAGIYSFTAIATDNQGSKSTSSSFTVNIVTLPRITSLTPQADSWVLQVSGTTGIPLTLENSLDLITWTELSTVAPSNSVAVFTVSSNLPKRFFRIKVQ